MTPEARRARAIRVKSLLIDDDFNAALDDIERDIIAEWTGSLWARTRERKWHELKGLGRLRQRLTNYAGQAPR